MAFTFRVSQSINVVSFDYNDPKQGKSYPAGTCTFLGSHTGEPWCATTETSGDLMGPGGGDKSNWDFCNPNCGTRTCVGCLLQPRFELSSFQACLKTCTATVQPVQCVLRRQPLKGPTHRCKVTAAKVKYTVVVVVSSQLLITAAASFVSACQE